MDETALCSDVVLPAATYHEKMDINTTDCHSYIHPFGKACEPLLESKTDWDIFRALAAKMAEIATRLKPFPDDAFGWNRNFTQLPEHWTGHGAEPQHGSGLVFTGSSDFMRSRAQRFRNHAERDDEFEPRYADPEAAMQIQNG